MLLPSTSTWRASRADWLALAARPRVRLVLTAVRPEGGDEALRRGEVAGQSVGGEVRGCGQCGHLALQGRDGCRVRADVGGVLGACLQGRVRREDCGQLPCGDALELYDRRLRDAVVQDPPREGGWKQGHIYISPGH